MTVEMLIDSLKQYPKDMQVCNADNQVIMSVAEDSNKGILRLKSKSQIDISEFLDTFGKEMIESAESDGDALSELLDYGVTLTDLKDHKEIYFWAIKTANENGLDIGQPTIISREDAEGIFEEAIELKDYSTLDSTGYYYVYNNTDTEINCCIDVCKLKDEEDNSECFCIYISYEGEDAQGDEIQSDTAYTKTLEKKELVNAILEIATAAKQISNEKEKLTA